MKHIKKVKAIRQLKEFLKLTAVLILGFDVIPIAVLAGWLVFGYGG